jgi:hypothetical protein
MLYTAFQAQPEEITALHSQTLSKCRNPRTNYNVGMKLETTAFHEASVLVTSMSVIKRFIMLGDVHKGVTFLQMAEGSGAFNNLSKVPTSISPRPRLLFIRV